MNLILIALITLGVIGAIGAVILYFVAQKFYVYEDPQFACGSTSSTCAIRGSS